MRMALLVLLGMTIAIGGALAFQHIGGYVPCALCYLQREPYYYAAMPAALLALVLSMAGGPATAVRLLLVLTALGLLATAAIGVYHSGVEWKLWPGPASCGSPADAISKDVGNLLSSLSNTKPPSCDKAAIRILGLSFAGLNVIVSSIMAAMAWYGATASDE